MAPTSRPDEFGFIVVSPAGPPDAALAIAGSRAGALGVLNLEFTTAAEAALGELGRLSRSARRSWGVLVADEELLAGILGERLEGLDAVLISSRTATRLGELIEQVHAAGLKAYAIATKLEEANAAEAAGADAVIAKGYEAGGWIGEEGSFVLLQRLLDGVSAPVWAARRDRPAHGSRGVRGRRRRRPCSTASCCWRASPRCRTALARGLPPWTAARLPCSDPRLGAPLRRLRADRRLAAVNELRGSSRRELEPPVTTPSPLARHGAPTWLGALGGTP